MGERIPRDRLQGAFPFPPILPIARTTRGSDPLMGACLSHRRSCSDNFTPRASRVAGSADLTLTAMRGRKAWLRGEGALACGLFRAVHIHHPPGVSQAVAHFARRAERRPRHQISEQEGA